MNEAPVAGRIPPHDLDAEAAVLSAVLLEPHALDRVSDKLRPDHFYSEANRRIFEAALALSSKATPVDIVSVGGELRDRERLQQVGGSAYLAQLVDAVPSVARIETYSGMVSEKWRVRQVISTCQRLAAEGYGDVGDAREWLQGAERAIYEISRTEDQRAVVHIEHVVEEAYRLMCEAEMRAGQVELPTGLVELDRLIGGLGRGRLTTIAGRPGMGKTSLATNAAETIASVGGPVAIFSLEMPRWQLATRIACGRSNLSVFKAIHGFLSPGERSLLVAANDGIARLPIWIDDTAGLTLCQLRSKSRLAAAMAGHQLALIVIDYVQLMCGDAATREREVAEITAGCKRLAKEMNCAVLMLAQLNRAIEKEKDKRPRLSDLRESGAIEQDSDDVIFVYRDEMYDPNSEDRGLAELIVAKQRNGPTGSVKVGFDGTSTNFFNQGER